MGSKKGGKPSRTSPNVPLHTHSKPHLKKKGKKKSNPKQPPPPPHHVEINDRNDDDGNDNESVAVPPLKRLSVFLGHYPSAGGIQLSSLELESIRDRCIVDLTQGPSSNVATLGKQIKVAFGSSWKDVLCDNTIVEGQVDPGSPAVLAITTSALRSIELLRGFKSLTKECRAAKLFSKHIRVEEQVALLKNRVNIAAGTPNRIKKLIDIEALGLSRLSVILFDLHVDVKGYSLLTLPQVRDEFWDLYKTYFHQRLVEGSLRIGFFGPLPNAPVGKRRVQDEVFI